MPDHAQAQKQSAKGQIDGLQRGPQGEADRPNLNRHPSQDQCPGNGDQSRGQGVTTPSERDGNQGEQSEGEKKNEPRQKIVRKW